MIDGKKVVATIEARMSSTRLPGKVLMPMAGRPVLQHVVERHRKSKLTDEVVVATTTNTTDDVIEALCAEIHCPIFRGSEKDVLGRIVAAGDTHDAEIQVQGMSDDPCTDWRFVDHLIALLLEGGYDCADSELSESFPVGLGMRVYRFSALEKAAADDKEPALREHAGYSIRSQPEKYKLGSWQAKGNMNWPTLRLTLDTREDYELISKVYDELYPENSDFSADDVVTLLKNRPDLAMINSHVVQRDPSKASY